MLQFVFSDEAVLIDSPSQVVKLVDTRSIETIFLAAAAETFECSV